MYEKKILPNGVRIVSEKMSHVRSAAVGIWVGVGSRHEGRGEAGAAHFIEHMLFKGTERHSASELAGIMDGIGGQINAFTTRESTCFYARVLDTHLDTAVDLLSDMFFSSMMREEDVKNECGVIGEEIDMYDDTPEDLVVERLLKKSLPGALGRPVLGGKASIAAMSGEFLRDFMDRNYTADRVVIALCGSFEDSHLSNIEQLFSGLGTSKRPKMRPGRYLPSLVEKRKSIEQNHLCLAFPGLAAGDERRFAFQLMSSILGGGMSSRLFQSVREKEGLCYSIYTFQAGFSDVGLLGIATALGRETEEKALRLISDEISRFLDSGVTSEELGRAREQVKSNIVMMMESTSSRMNKLGSGELLLGGSYSPDELIAKYDAVTSDDILTLARRLLTIDKLSFSAVGRVRRAEEYASILSNK